MLNTGNWMSLCGERVSTDFPSFIILVLPPLLINRCQALDKPSENESSLRLLSVTGFCVLFLPPWFRANFNKALARGLRSEKGL